MKKTLISLAAFALTAAILSVPMPAPRSIAAQPPAKAVAEALPDAPKLDPKNNHVALDRDGTFLIEMNPDKKGLRVLVKCEVCLREGSLEVFGRDEWANVTHG